jgi:alanyl-tRNA synthetase
LILEGVHLSALELDKESLRKNFSKEYEKYYDTSLFRQEGFKRRQCRICGMMFWSIEDRDVCGNPDHNNYSFFKEKPTPISYKSLWDNFSNFFKENGHTEIKRYPVVSRWRQDLYFTIASIQDFQRIENGRMSFEYGANPLIVPQVCLRFGDTENVGITGRHLTSFMMAGQHAFNWPTEGYWRDRTIELDYKFLINKLKVDKNSLIFHEDVWAMGDFSEFGPCLESFSNGLELLNSVFTQFESHNGNVKELDGKVVDVGWGFERLLWYYTGFNNIYEAVFHDVLKNSESELGINFNDQLFKSFAGMAGKLDVTEESGRDAEHDILKKLGISNEEYANRIKPVQAMYAVFDHARTLLFAVSDGALPSNIGGGYNLRVLLRRALGFIEEYDLGMNLIDIAALHAEDLKSMYPELSENLTTLAKIIDVEEKRYSKSRKSAEKVVESMISKGREIKKDDIRMLYESNGVTPEIISSVAAKKNIKIDIPKGVYEGMLKNDFTGRVKQKKEFDIPFDINPTIQLYYDFATESDSNVLYANSNIIVLDKTPFYPEGGGQACDTGAINSIPVIDVQKVGNVIVHVLDPAIDIPFKKNESVHCVVDKDRRDRLIAHHTATHLISSGSRHVLGRHAWQEGSRKEPDKAHIDIAHYEKLTDEEINAIEDFANNAVFSGITVTANEMHRGDAESKYGFSIYQGRGVPAKTMRMVVVKDKEGKVIDAEACGGLHAAGRENIIGIVKIINTYRIHDGVDRIEFVAGKAAIDYFRKEDKELSAIAIKMNSEKLDVSGKVNEVVDNYIESLKSIGVMEETSAKYASQELMNSKEDVVEMKNVSRKFMRKVAESVIHNDEKRILLLKNSAGDVVCLSGKESEENAVEFAKKKLGSLGFVGGGTEKIAEGKINKE